MMKHFLRNEDGAAAIEFAVTAPLLIFVTLSGVVIGLALWQWNGLQSAAKGAARCVALNSVACGKVSAGCKSGDAGVCYAMDQARAIGIGPGIDETNVVINRNDTIDGMSVTTVSINQPFTLLSSSFTLKAKASFPN